MSIIIPVVIIIIIVKMSVTVTVTNITPLALPSPGAFASLLLLKITYLFTADMSSSEELPTLLLLWCRVEAGGNRRVIDDLLKADMLEVLRANDQLKRERKLGKVFMVSTASLDGIPPQPSCPPSKFSPCCMTVSAPFLFGSFAAS